MALRSGSPPATSAAGAEGSTARSGHPGAPIQIPNDLDAALWARHRWVRLVVALVAVPAALLSPDYRAWLVAFALMVYLPVALVVAASPRKPQALGASWWVAVAADSSGLALTLAVVPGSESVVLLGMLLVVIVNGASFGARAGIATVAVVEAATIAGHAAVRTGHSDPDLAVHLVALTLAVGLATYLVGRQAEDLRAHRRGLERALAELRRVDELRSGLVSTLAHDVRGPLGSIRGSVRTVLRLRGQLDDRSETDLLQGIDRQSSRLLRLANGLLDLARLEEGRLELDLRSVSLRETVAEALSYADPMGVIQVDVDPDVCLLADTERLEQIIVNLATNSLRHGEAPFVVSSTVADGCVDVTFSDSGRGVAAELVDSLFEPFRRGDTTGSVGFGLWIVRMLAEAQGGSVRYEPNVPSGARFAVRLPVSTLVQAGGGPRAAGEGNPPLGC